MAFPIINYASSELMKSPINDIINNLFSGYSQGEQAKYLEPNLAAQLKKQQLENQYYGPNIESQMGLRGAQAGHLGSLTEAQNITNPFLRQKLEQEQAQRQFGLENPLLSKTGTAGQVGALMYLQQHPELLGQMQQQQQQPINDLAQLNAGQSYIPPIGYQQQSANQAQLNPLQMLQNSILKSLEPKINTPGLSYLGKMTSEAKDIEEGFYPGTNRSVPIESYSKRDELLAPYKEQLGALKKGTHFVYDKEGKAIAAEVPLSPDERKTEEGRVFFNEIFPDTYKGIEPYVGKGSYQRFVNDVNNYYTDKKAMGRIDDLYYANSLLTAGIINEQATLKAGKTNLNFKKIMGSYPHSDIPELLKSYQGTQVGGEANTKAAQRFQSKMNKATELAAHNVPLYKKIPLHGELKKEAEEHQEKITAPSENYTKNEINIAKSILEERRKKAKKK